MSKQLKVDIVYNIKRGFRAGPPDSEAEFDDLETILAIKKALETSGRRVGLIEADENFPSLIAQSSPDIVFNIAEGANGRGREAQVPAILNFLNIPFVGSDETAMCVAMDKALAKSILAARGISTPKFTVIGSESDYDNPAPPPFPAIVKPVAEGSGKGITNASIVSSSEELAKVSGELVSRYSQAALVEEFISGREFTVGLLGNGSNTRVFTPMEVIFRENAYKTRDNAFSSRVTAYSAFDNAHYTGNDAYNIYSYDIKRNFKQYIDYACPPEVEDAVIEDLEKTALKIYRILQCRDFARIDFRMSREGRLYFIEINPIPGLAPGYSDYPMLAAYCGVDYEELICSILNSALARYGL